MDTGPFPDDLAELEGRLARRLPEPPGLRARVLAAVRRELRPQPYWRFAVAVAAAVLVWINFSTSLINSMDWHLNVGVDRGDLDKAARRLAELMPDMPP